MGEANVSSRIMIRKTNYDFSLCHSYYIEKVLEKFNCFDVTLVRTPYNPSIRLKKNKLPSVF